MPDVILVAPAAFKGTLGPRQVAEAISAGARRALPGAAVLQCPISHGGDGLVDALDEANWGAGFVAKMQIPETGGLRNHVNQGPGRNWTKWSAPEFHTDDIPGTDDDPVIQPGEGQSPLIIRSACSTG